MTGIIEVSGDWLALREPEDARARSRELALAAARRIGPGPSVVHDLGSGTGSMMRWLAPLLPGPQTWVLHDWNEHLAEQAAEAVPLDRDGREVAIRTRTEALADLRPDDLDGAALVTASALLDVLTSAEIDALVGACVAVGCPVLLSLSVTGEVRLGPPDPRDEVLAAAFNAHQQRRVDGRRLVGPTGAGLARRLFQDAGWQVRAATTLWRLGDHEPRLLHEWLDGWIGAAVEHGAGAQLDVEEYRARRSAQLREGTLSADIVHTDLLAWP